MSYHPSMGDFGTKPDWLMIGVQCDDGVVIIASQELSSAELAKVVVDYDPFDPDRFFLTGDSWDVTARMSRFVIVKGVDYPDALVRLIQHWTPPVNEEPRSPTVPRLPSGVLGLPGVW